MLDMTKPYRYFYVEGVTGMRMGHYRLCNVIKETLKRDPYNGDVYIFMSKKRNTVKLLRYENHAYTLYTKTYEHEFQTTAARGTGHLDVERTSAMQGVMLLQIKTANATLVKSLVKFE